MLGLAGIPLGLSFRFLDPAPDAPAGAVGELLVGAYDDVDLLARLADGADVVTYEFENVPVEAARRVGAVPGPAALEAAQDRLAEKRLFRRLGIPTARIDDEVETFPALLKTRRLGYDGKGQHLVDERPGPNPDHVLEELVAFDRELSLIAVRAPDGETRFYPLVENVHEDGILRSSRAPAVDAPQALAEDYAGRVLEELDYVGVLALELFEADGDLLANELAPRVHNTGHWTIEGAVDEPVREPPPRGPRAAARPNRPARRGRDGEPHRHAAAARGRPRDPRRAPPPVREGAAARPQARARHAARPDSRARAGARGGRRDVARPTGVTAQASSGLVRVLRCACGCAWKYSSRRRRSVTCV